MKTGLPSVAELEALMRGTGQCRKYHEPATQLEMFQQNQLFHGLDGRHVLVLSEGISTADDGGLLVLPKTSVMGGYHSALAVVLQLLRTQLGQPSLAFQSCPILEPGHQYERSAHSDRALSDLEAITPGDYIVVPVALRQPAGTVNAVFSQIQKDPEQWHLGPYELGMLLWLHSRWLQQPGPMELFCDGYLWRGHEREFQNRLGYLYYDLFGLAIRCVFDYVIVSSVAVAVATAR